MHQKNKSILITGCSSGIGLCAAQGLLKKGYRVFAGVRSQEDVSKLKTQGLVDALLLDLDDPKSIQKAVEEVIDKNHGELYALFNNAGYQQPGAVEDLTRDSLRKNFETNLFGTHELTTKIIPIMRQQGYGRIVQNSSILGFIGLPYRGAYNATKFAMEGLSDTLRLELHNTNIHVSLIQPGPITSKLRARALKEFKTNIDIENSAHKNQYFSLEKRLATVGKKAPFTLAPDAVLEKVIHALECDKPKARYYVTQPTLILAWLKRIVSNQMLDNILLKISEKEQKKK